MLCLDATSSVMPFVDEERRKAAVETTKQKTVQKVKLTDLQRKILFFLHTNPTATRNTMAQVLQGYSASGINYAVARLQEMNLLKRVGGRKDGHWEVIDLE